jgi:hypothetical protein
MRDGRQRYAAELDICVVEIRDVKMVAGARVVLVCLFGAQFGIHFADCSARVLVHHRVP